MKFSSDTFILDNSVLAKCFFTEEGTDKANCFLEALHQGKIKIIIPEIGFAEFGNTCWKHVRKELISIDEALGFVDSLVKLPVQWYPDSELLDVALENGYHYGISVYDALYVSLAEVYVAPLVTADKNLFEACRKRFDFIEFLGDMK